MSLFKRKDSSVYWVKITINGRTVQKSTGTPDKTKAQEFHDRLKAQLWEQTKLGAKRGYSWNEAVVRWLDQYLNGVTLDAINLDALDKLIQAKLETDVSNSTVNHAGLDSLHPAQSRAGMGMAGEGAEDSSFA